MKILLRIIAIVVLAHFALLARSDQANGSAIWQRRPAAAPTPVLPIHVWATGRQHFIGLLVSSRTGECHFTALLHENSAEPAREGYWIESSKVDAIRKLMPSALDSVRFSDETIIGNVLYWRVQPVDVAPRRR